ncbi:amino acid ABC transporter membrane protein 1 (PAAT family) [Pseudaminobacter salicylatoxidans]|uniref:Amino acid ABC transporter membrane protein 1 (PAAT family) n=1 Tax=Pseudaminobacter salicylatoxidans TaxID=93369 RepID=A0A316BU48_PSESE|nr:ABC transporter permease [Pseudaminobacter salicylatoxidans]PWJ76930.1 amino acid ABC transporter membrane protein 1 (PAAT family) [Pseudaminobacter salicylatoxidans]
MESSIWTLLSWGPEGWSRSIASGVLVTISLALATLPLGLFVGFLVALAKQSSEPTLRMAGNIYTTIFRGLPELLTLFLVFYGAQLGIQQIVRIVSPGTTVEINSFVAGMVALGVVFSSYASEVFLSAFRAIPLGQYEGGYSIGLSKRQTMRLVVLPQLIRIALPGLSNLWLALLKDTALVSVIGLSDILRQATIAARVTKESFLFFGVACLAYLVLAILSSFGIDAIERAVGKKEMQR